MKAVNKLGWKLAGSLLLVACFIMLWQCSNPATQNNLRWQSVIDVPLTNDSFFIGQQMTGLFTQINGQNITVIGSGRSPKDTGVYYDTTNPNRLITDTVPGDTVSLSILQNDTISYDVHQDSMASQTYHPRLGPIQISNAAAYSVTVPVPANSFNIPATVPLTPYIATVTFDAGSPAMPVTITNSSSGTITGLNVSMLANNQVVSSLGPNSSITIQVPVAGQTISGGALSIGIQGSASAAASLNFSINPNGLLASSAQIMDSLVTFNKVDTNDYNLTDTLNIDYIDIMAGSFLYQFHNYTQIPLELNVTQLNVWSTPYSVLHGLTSVATLSNFTGQGGISSTDSLDYYSGQTTTGYQLVNQGATTTTSLKANLSDMRLFPIWNPNIVNTTGGTGESVARVLYTVTNEAPRGAMVTINEGDSMLFSISSPGFKFAEMAGRVALAYVRNGDTAKVAVPFPWDSASKDSLQGKLILQKVWADLFLTPNLPDSISATMPGAFIDTLGITYSIFNPDSPLVQVDSSTKLYNVVDSSIFRLSPTNITSIIRQYPDSLYIAVGVNVPVGTYLRSVNELTNPSSPNYPLYMGQMFLKSNVTARMNAALAWQVTSSTSLDLGTGRFKVPKASRYITKMDGITATVHMNTLNSSNVYLNLYALMAPQAHMNALDSLPLDSVWTYIGDSAMAHRAGYVDLLGANGVPIPMRDSTAVDSIVLNTWQIDSILQSDSAGWRWEARFLPMNSSDALKDVDFIKIRSWMHLVGNNNMDSLLIWH